MFKKNIFKYFQYGVHTTKNVKYDVAKMKHWPKQEIPQNFNFTSEQRFRAKTIPRDVGKIPRNFVLSILYQHQPCEVSSLWSYCENDPRIVLDSKRHLREVLQQTRAEGFITFEQDVVTQRWVCHLTRERYEEVRAIVLEESTNRTADNEVCDDVNNLKTNTELNRLYELSQEARTRHCKLLQEQVTKTTQKLRRFQRTEIDYLPYTDLNGKVNFMWWYETADVEEPSVDTTTQISEQKEKSKFLPNEKLSKNIS